MTPKIIFFIKAERFRCRGEGLRDALTMSRMQKAAAILQFKIEGQVVARHPEYGMDERSILHRIDAVDGSVEIDGRRWPLRDTHFPTLDWTDPYALSEAESACLSHLTEAFLASPVLWQQMRFVSQNGSTFALRDSNLIFHGCVPVDAAGNFLNMTVDGVRYQGQALFDALNGVVHRAFRTKAQEDLDNSGPLCSTHGPGTGPAVRLFCEGRDHPTTFPTTDPNLHYPPGSTGRIVNGIPLSESWQ